MIRKPIEHKNTGPYRKILINILGDQIVNGTEFNKAKVEEIIGKLESKTDNERYEILELVDIKEDDYFRLLSFFRICLTFINNPLPPDIIDAGSNLKISRLEKVVRYENFSYDLVLVSEKYKIVFPQKLRNDEAPNIESRNIRDKIRNDIGYDINIYALNGDVLQEFKNEDPANSFPGSFISIDEPYIICAHCDNIETSMVKNDFYNLEAKDNTVGEINTKQTNVLDNGWEISQQGGAQNSYYNSLLPKFLKEIRHDEIRKTYWCSYCSSLIFTRLFGKINQDSFELGITTFIDEEIPERILIKVPLNFTLFMSNKILNAGNLIIYNKTIGYYKLVRETSTRLSIMQGVDIIGTLSFDVANKIMDIKLDKNIIGFASSNSIALDNTKNTTFLFEFSSEVVLYDQLNSLEEYETMYSTFIYTNERKECTCFKSCKEYICNDCLKPCEECTCAADCEKCACGKTLKSYEYTEKCDCYENIFESENCINCSCKDYDNNATCEKCEDCKNCTKCIKCIKCENGIKTMEKGCKYKCKCMEKEDFDTGDIYYEDENGDRSANGGCSYCKDMTNCSGSTCCGDCEDCLCNIGCDECESCLDLLNCENCKDIVYGKCSDCYKRYRPYKDYIGCIMRNDILAPAVKWVPKRVTFGELRNYTFERVGIDLTLFYTFED